MGQRLTKMTKHLEDLLQEKDDGDDGEFERAGR